LHNDRKKDNCSENKNKKFPMRKKTITNTVISPEKKNMKNKNETELKINVKNQ
jgi:hypothetical protein